MILGGFSIPHSLSFLVGFSYTKDNGYLAVIMGVFGVFRLRMQLNDALIAFRAHFLSFDLPFAVYESDGKGRRSLATHSNHVTAWSTDGRDSISL